MKRNLGKFSDDPNKYIDAFQSLTQMFKLPYRELMILLGQTLSSSEKKNVLQKAREFGDQVYLTVALGYPDQSSEEKKMFNRKSSSPNGPQLGR